MPSSSISIVSSTKEDKSALGAVYIAFLFFLLIRDLWTAALFTHVEVTGSRASFVLWWHHRNCSANVTWVTGSSCSSSHASLSSGMAAWRVCTTSHADSRWCSPLRDRGLERNRLEAKTHCTLASANMSLSKASPSASCSSGEPVTPFVIHFGLYFSM